MDDETKRSAMKKANSIRPHLGYPDFILNETMLNDYYSAVSDRVTSSFTSAIALQLVLKSEMSYFEMMETLMHWSRYKEYEFLLKPFDKDWFESSPVDVNAYYSPEKNAISTH